MRLAGRILSAGMQGYDVRDLHEDLEALDILVPSPERRGMLFGPGTKKAVSELQRENFGSASRVNGIVDQATANMITQSAARYV